MLTDTAIRNAKPSEKHVTLFDDSGLYLEVAPAGGTVTAQVLLRGPREADFGTPSLPGRAERDPAADLRGTLPPVKEKHHAALTDPKAMGELLRAIDGYRGSFVTGAEPGLYVG